MEKILVVVISILAMVTFYFGTSIVGQNIINTTNSNISTGGLNLTNLTALRNITDSTALKANELIMNSS
jgi:hypothetical protein